jgi:hemin uptake protein HemP
MMFEHPMHDTQPSSNRTPAATSVPPREPRRVSTEDLIGSAREVLIRHAGCDYRLRITRQGKLILTK